MPFAATSEATELAYHVLAHVPLEQPGSSFDRRYHAWLALHRDEDPRLRADGARVAAVKGVASLVHRLPELYDDGTLPAACRRALAELQATDVGAPAVLRAMQRDGGVACELLHVMVGLERAEHARRFRATVAPSLSHSAEALALLCASAGPLARTLADRRIELSWALGPRGRVLDGRIVVGAPADWHDGTLEHTAVLSLHEHYVAEGHGAWAPREWTALCELAIAIPSAPTVLQHTHARWLATLELGELLAWAQASAGLDPELAERIMIERSDRAALLRTVQ